MRTEDLLREFVEYEWWLATFRGEVVEVGGLRAVRNDALPLVYDCNLAWVDPPGGATLEELQGWWDHAFVGSPSLHRNFVFPDAGAAYARQGEFAAAGYVPRGGFVMLQTGEATCVANEEVDVRAVPPAHEDFRAIRRAVVEAEWPPEVADQLLRAGDLEIGSSGCLCFVAYLRGEPAGTIGLHRRGGLGVVDYVGTAPASRSRGVGLTMLCAMVEESKLAGQKHLALWVDLDNPARTLYERLTFRPIGEIRTFVLPGPAGSL